MILIDLTPEEIEALHYERYHHPHPKVQRKMEALWLKSQGLPHKQITRLTGISPNTFRAYLRKKVNFWLTEQRLKIIFGQIRRRPLKKRRQKSTN